MHIPRRQWSRRPPPNNEPIYLTPEGIKRLESKLELLKRSLPAIIDEAARTAAYGDRSDNAEYKEAKSILRRTRGQILNIEGQFRRVVVIHSGTDAAGKIQLGSTVELESKGRARVYRILGSSETDPEKGRISHTSPLGAALLGNVKNDLVVVQTPKGPQEYRVLDVR